MGKKGIKCMSKVKEYALYKGDTFIDLGTIKELAKKLGVNERTVQYYVTPSHLKRCQKHDENGNYLIVIKLDEEDL